MSLVSVRDRLRYKDISWLMPSINLDDVLPKIGAKIDHKDGKVIRAWCPDHFLMTGRMPSDPNWVISPHTGETNCFTESRGSNLIWTTCRILKCSPREAEKFLTGVTSESALTISAIMNRVANIRRQEVETPRDPVFGLDLIAKDIENRFMPESAYQFFLQPPEKKLPTNIRKETVDRYKVFFRTGGYYMDRVFIPVFMREVLVGFCAVDVLGKTAWMKKHPAMDDKKYRKTLFPLNFQSGECLFGYDDCQRCADDLFVVEGAREKMKLFQEGFPNSVAIFGSHLGDKHLELIAQLAPKRIVLMFDGDAAGASATDKIAVKLEESVFKKRVKKCFLPVGKDPKNLDGKEIRELISA